MNIEDTNKESKGKQINHLNRIQIHNLCIFKLYIYTFLASNRNTHKKIRRGEQLLSKKTYCVVSN
jgi:hypothetical protein